jgi:hypothetical protein
MLQMYQTEISTEKLRFGHGVRSNA